MKKRLFNVIFISLLCLFLICSFVIIYIITSRDNADIPAELFPDVDIAILFSKENWKQYESLIFSSNSLNRTHSPIISEERKRIAGVPKTSGMWRPEELGEDFSNYSSDQLLAKLETGDKVEQRKAANELWKQYGDETSGKFLMEKASKRVEKSVSRYLRVPFEQWDEGFSQNLRLWHLAVPGLLKNITDEDVNVSENAARLLSKMKTPEIVTMLVAESELAFSESAIRKYIFALKYMAVTNPCNVKNRKQISTEETENLYNTKVLPQIKRLEKKLETL